MKTIAANAFKKSDKAQKQIEFAVRCSCGYTRPVTSKKGVIGIGVLKHRCDVSRSFSFAESAASLFVPQFMVARTGERKLRRFAQAVPGTPTCSSYRPQLALGAVVFVNRTAWRPFMADTTTQGQTAPAIANSSALADLEPHERLRAELALTDLSIRITPYRSYFYGTLEQIRAEFDLPDDLRIPTNYARTSNWEVGKVCFGLRKFPPGYSKKIGRSLSGEQTYELTTERTDRPRISFADEQIKRKALELADLLRGRGSDWRRTHRAWCKARFGAPEFQAFLTPILQATEKQRSPRKNVK